MTHVKAKSKAETLKIDEVQSAMNDMSNNLKKNKDEWLTPEFFQKLA